MDSLRPPEGEYPALPEGKPEWELRRMLMLHGIRWTGPGYVIQLTDTVFTGIANVSFPP